MPKHSVSHRAARRKRKKLTGVQSFHDGGIIHNQEEHGGGGSPTGGDGSGIFGNNPFSRIGDLIRGALDAEETQVARANLPPQVLALFDQVASYNQVALSAGLDPIDPEDYISILEDLTLGGGGGGGGTSFSVSDIGPVRAAIERAQLALGSRQQDFTEEIQRLQFAASTANAEDQIAINDRLATVQELAQRLSELRLQVDSQLTVRGQDISLFGIQVQQRGQDISQQQQTFQSQIDLLQTQLNDQLARGQLQLAQETQNQLIQLEERRTVLDQFGAEVTAAEFGQAGQQGAGNIFSNLGRDLGNIENVRNQFLTNLLANPRDAVQAQIALGGGESFFNQLLAGETPGAQGIGQIGTTPLLGELFTQLLQQVSARPELGFFDQAAEFANQLGTTQGPQAPTLEQLQGPGIAPVTVGIPTPQEQARQIAGEFQSSGNPSVSDLLARLQEIPSAPQVPQAPAPIAPIAPPTLTQPSTQPIGLPGDINNDQLVNSIDAALLLQQEAGLVDDQFQPFKHGGEFVTDQPLVMVGTRDGQVKATLGEPTAQFPGGAPEKVEITPFQEGGDVQFRQVGAPVNPRLPTPEDKARQIAGEFQASGNPSSTELLAALRPGGGPRIEDRLRPVTPRQPGDTPPEFIRNPTPVTQPSPRLPTISQPSFKAPGSTVPPGIGAITDPGNVRTTAPIVNSPEQQARRIAAEFQASGNPSSTELLAALQAIPRGAPPAPVGRAPGEILQGIRQGIDPSFFFRKMLPSQRAFLESQISALGLDPNDFFKDLVRGFPEGVNPAAIQRASFKDGGSVSFFGRLAAA